MKKHIHLILLILIISLLSLRLIYLFSARTSYYCDEVYTYGISNSLGNPLLVWNDNTTNNLYKSFKEQWYDGSILHDYLTINSDERFQFKDVILNKLWDNAPPNYELMVHFVSSLFPGTFSWAYAFVVNFVFFIASLILVFFISKDSINNSYFKNFNSFICMTFMGLSICGTGAFTFLRMYGVLCFYGLLMIYAINRILNTNSLKISEYFLLFISFLGGIFTHTLFIVFAFWLTLFTCIYILAKKQIFKSFITGLTVLLSLLLFFIIYPFDYDKAGAWMGYQNSDGYSFFTNLSIANKYTFLQSIGIYIPFTYANILIWSGTIVFISIIICIICILFRKENWFTKCKIKTIAGFKNASSYIIKSIKNISPIIPIMFLSSLGYMIVISAISPIVSQGIYSVRYLLLCMNPIIICFISIIGSIFVYNAEKKSNISKILFVSVLSGLLFFQNCITENPLLFTNHDDYTELHNVIVGKDVAVYASKTPFLNNMIIPLRDTSHFYFDKITSDKKYNLDLPEKDFYIIVDETIFINSDQSLVTYYNYIPGVENSEEFINYVLTENADKYNISFVNEYIINRGLYSLYYLEPK